METEIEDLSGDGKTRSAKNAKNIAKVRRRRRKSDANGLNTNSPPSEADMKVDECLSVKGRYQTHLLSLLLNTFLH